MRPPGSTWPSNRKLAVVQRAFNGAVAALTEGDLATARRWADESIALATGWHLPQALIVRARIAIANRDPDAAEHDIHQAISLAADLRAFICLPDLLECLADVTATDANPDEAARLFGAAESARLTTGMVRYKVHDAWYEASVDGAANGIGTGATSTPHGPRVPRCRSRMPSPTPSAAAANASARRAAGSR